MKNNIEFNYRILEDFCKVKNLGTAFQNSSEPTPRVQFLLNLCKDLGIETELDVFIVDYNYYYNIYLKGSGDKAIMAHHDIVNPISDNCLDNSASCINAIASKLLNPELNVFINDGEEIMGIGAKQTTKKINEDYFGDIDFVFNLELTGVGGDNFFVESNFPYSKLYQKIKTLFPMSDDMNRLPFHDGVILRSRGIDSIVVTTLPRLKNGLLDYSLLNMCHSINDEIKLANFNDMKYFVENVIQKIIE